MKLTPLPIHVVRNWRLAIGLVCRRFPIFHRRGAYRRFKDLLERADVLPAWYDFEREATLQALRDWVEALGLEVHVAERRHDG